MKKISQELDSEINGLVSQLMGEQMPGGGGSATSEVVNKDLYQLPVKHTKGGVLIDETNKPWMVGAYSATPFLRPVDNTVRPHYGTDLAAPKGSPVYPIGSGIVTAAQGTPQGHGGRTINMSHEDGKVTSYYAHLDRVRVSVGDQVSATTIIADLGDSGNARGAPHLHYEVKIDGKRVDPQSIVGKEVGSLSKKAQFIKSLINKFNSAESNSTERLLKLKNIIK